MKLLTHPRNVLLSRSFVLVWRDQMAPSWESSHDDPCGLSHVRMNKSPGAFFSTEALYLTTLHMYTGCSPVGKRQTATPVYPCCSFTDRSLYSTLWKIILNYYGRCLSTGPPVHTATPVSSRVTFRSAHRDVHQLGSLCARCVYSAAEPDANPEPDQLRCCS